MKARLVIKLKELRHGGIVEIVIWQLPHPDEDRPHGFKYRMVFIRKGMRIVGYDNERGKGDHRHIQGREKHYTFTNLSTLLNDFWRDVKDYGG